MEPVVESALISAVATLVSVGGTATVAYLGFRLSRYTLATTRASHLTERYSKAIEQIGSENLDVRIGGIYALESLARDSAIYQSTMMEVLTAFIRNHSQRRPAPPGDASGRDEEQSPPPDVNAAVTVIVRRRERPGEAIDLNGANLAGAYLGQANLRRSDLYKTILTGASLGGADLTEAVLYKADLSHAWLNGARLDGADLRSVNLDGADLTGAFFDGARLTDAKWPAGAPVPKGWKLDADSGRLAEAGTEPHG